MRGTVRSLWKKIKSVFTVEVQLNYSGVIAELQRGHSEVVQRGPTSSALGLCVLLLLLLVLVRHVVSLVVIPGKGMAALMDGYSIVV